jgi:lysophospholipase L1-like esterase
VARRAGAIIGKQTRLRRTLRLAGPLLALGLYVLADLGVAQVCRRVFPWWEPSYFERDYRIPSLHYHHGLASNISVRAHWGDIEYPFSTNSLGFRDAKPRQVSLKAKSGRILLLGDSFTEGIGVPYEETFAGILDSAARNQGIEVLNAAVSSYSPLIYHLKTRHYLERVGLRFGAILVFLDISDPYDQVHRYHATADGRIESIQGRTPLTDRAGHWLRYNSVVGRAMTMALLAYGGYSPSPFGLGQNQARWSYDERTFAAYGARGLELTRQRMDSLLQIARHHGIRLTVVIYPYPDQIVRRHMETLYTRFWKDWAERNAVPLVNLFPLFIDEIAPDSVLSRYFMPRDLHWNAAGHQLVADSLLADGEISRLFGYSAVADSGKAAEWRFGRRSTTTSPGR